MSKEIFATLDSETNDAQLRTLKKMLELMYGDTGADGGGGGIVINPGTVGGLVLAPWQHDIPAASLVNHASPGGPYTILGSITGFNNGPDQYIFVIDDASGFPPVTRPFCIIKVFSGTTFSFDWGPSGVKCPNGIMAVNSTTAPNFTAGAADCFFSFTMRP